MVDRAGCWTNHGYITELIAFLAIPKQTDSAFIAELYLNQGLTARQIATKLGIGRTLVVTKLHEQGIRRNTLKDISHAKPRPVSQAPYGQKIVNGQLVENRQEMKTARLIVELRQRKRLPWNEIATKLNDSGLKTRMGKQWNIDSARAVFERWNGKL